MRSHRTLAVAATAVFLLRLAQDQAPRVDWAMVAKIRDEGLQRSKLADTLSYMTDVLGARLTLMAPFHDLGMTTASIQGVGSTDHVPFDNAGLPAFQFLQDRTGGTGGHTTSISSTRCPSTTS